MGGFFITLHVLLFNININGINVLPRSRRVPFPSRRNIDINIRADIISESYE